ncbi:hypothetical protein GCM10011611_56490 [Aliidongia dinghuensis]|uniref:Uncharacterized protein n=1 Tax=Aliidongia dinghuensis TaxID=1867774 RepID=A0A8J2YYT4_9PROT|nr:hypothetical protein GCM10011611_56490 [Aliidongia dinghuensis]
MFNSIADGCRSASVFPLCAHPGCRRQRMGVQLECAGSDSSGLYLHVDEGVLDQLADVRAAVDMWWFEMALCDSPWL